MKTAFVTDLHFGAREGSKTFDSYFRRFYEEYFFPKLKEEDIKTVIDLGDTFDRRKFISFAALDSCRQYFFDRLRDEGIELKVLVGNHDCPFKSTNFPNSPELILKDYENIEVFSSPRDLVIGDTVFGMVPWICAENYQESMDYIENTRATHLCVHMDMAGFEMHRGQVSSHGFDMNMFRKFDAVYSGHYHTRSQKNNIKYLGAPYQMTWADYNDPRGFHVFYHDTKEIKSFDNPFEIFVKFYYDDKNQTLEEIIDSIPDVNGCYVKIIVQSKNNPYWLELVEDRIAKEGAVSIQKVEMSVWINELEDLSLDEVEDTLSLIKRYCAETDTRDKETLEKLMLDLYEEALNQEL